MDTAHHWPQGNNNIGVVKSMGGADEGGSDPRSNRSRPPKDHALNCPRCNSTTTKFCYYNNYSLSQPRYFCKTCRRYWTEGGSLRNVPVGGGSRKNNKRPSSTTTSSSPNHQNKKLAVANHDESKNPKSVVTTHQGQDLNLAYPPTTTTTSDYDHHHIFNPSSSGTHNLSAMELLKSTGVSASRGLMSSFMAPIMFSTGHNGFPNLQEFKPSLSFSLDGYEGGGYLQEPSHHHQARLLFPNDQDLKQIPSTTTTTTSREEGGDDHHSGGYWSGMLGGGSW